MAYIYIRRLPPTAADEAEHAERALVPQPNAEVRVARNEVVRSIGGCILQLDVASVGEAERPEPNAVGEAQRSVSEERFVLQQRQQRCVRGRARKRVSGRL